MNESNLSERMRELIVFATDEYRRYKQLEITTGIQADTWKSWFHGRQRPTVEMIESVGKKWPEFAFWVTTGLTDEKYGHRKPERTSLKLEHNSITSLYLKALVECVFNPTNEELEILNKGRDVLAEFIPLPVAEASMDTIKPYSTFETLDALRSIEIFLDNYIFEFDIATSIEAYNKMRSLLKKVTANTSNKEVEVAVNLLLLQFNQIKKALEEKRDWIINSQSKE